MHTDITPFAPFSDANPLFRAIPLQALHWFCLGSGLLVVRILGVRYVVRPQSSR